MVRRSIEMREIGFPVIKPKRKSVIEEIRCLYQDEFEFSEEGEILWVKGDFHNRFKRRKIMFILSGGMYGKDV